MIYKLGFSGGTTVETTWNHPFWVSSTGTSTGSVSDITGSSTGKWIEAKDLRVGEKSHTANGTLVAISSIHTDNREETVYDFEVENDHTYFVTEDGVLVHNYMLGPTVAVMAVKCLTDLSACKNKAVSALKKVTDKFPGQEKSSAEKNTQQDSAKENGENVIEGGSILVAEKDKK